MPVVKTLGPNEQPGPGEVAVRLFNTTQTSLIIGISNGESMRFAPGVMSGYALREIDQHPRYLQRISASPTYVGWFERGYLTPNAPESERSRS